MICLGFGELQQASIAPSIETKSEDAHKYDGQRTESRQMHNPRKFMRGFEFTMAHYATNSRNKTLTSHCPFMMQSTI